MNKSNLKIDLTTRICECGHYSHNDQKYVCQDVCVKSFTMASYPIGYFPYKYQLRKGSVVNTCPPCEAQITDETAARADNDLLRQLLEDSLLLRTGKIVSVRHQRNAKKMHG